MVSEQPAGAPDAFERARSCAAFLGISTGPEMLVRRSEARVLLLGAGLAVLLVVALVALSVM